MFQVIAYYLETLDFTGIIRKQRIAARLICYMVLFGFASGVKEKSREENRIGGNEKFGRAWMIPKESEKPIDGRLKNNTS